MEVSEDDNLVPELSASLLLLLSVKFQAYFKNPNSEGEESPPGN